MLKISCIDFWQNPFFDEEQKRSGCTYCLTMPKNNKIVFYIERTSIAVVIARKLWLNVYKVPKHKF